MADNAAFNKLEVPENRVGLILQRGGEELNLLKVGDRLTLRLVSPDVELPPELGLLRYNALPESQLIEILVEADALERVMSMARRLDLVAFASHVYQLEKNPETLVYLTDELTIQFLDGMAEEEREAIADHFNLQLLDSLDGIADAFIYRLTPQSRENPIKLANRLAASDRVLLAEANILVRGESFYTPRDDFYRQQWYLYHRPGNQLSGNSHVDAEKAWDITRGSRSVIVAVADDAIDVRHPDFQGQGKVVSPRDFKNRDFSPQPDNSQESHGTACAGVAVAEENGQGVVGVAPGCALMPLRTTGYLDDNSIEQLFDWVVQKGASVMSCSWGAATVYFPLSMRQKAAITRAATRGRRGKGCVIVFAAGNANRPVQGTVYERGWQGNLLNGPTEWLSGFAAHPDVVTVSACSSLGKKSAYSNWGKHISVCAPSNNAPPGMWFQQTGFIQTAPPLQTYLPGLGIFTTDIMGNLGYDPGNFTRDFGGTSSACPVVAGVAGLVLSANPDLTAREVKEILQQTADKIVDRDRDPQLGLQLGTYDRNGHSQWFGYGKVNAYQAVQEAKRRSGGSNSGSGSGSGSDSGSGSGSGGSIPRTLREKNTRDLTIADNNSRGVTSKISIRETGNIKDIQVKVNLNHGFLGDIEVSLLAPTGEEILLQNRTLGSQTVLQKTYSLQTTPLFKKLKNRPCAGTWQLKITDFAVGDRGKLEEWELILRI
ncbi:MAG: S8 family serine peptidase [Cyanobacteria bacterium SBLK]|nr:S8 family serine peptidase [Cyanobacteria bacterium SBLK]